jgi:hypothetical protein
MPYCNCSKDLYFSLGLEEMFNGLVCRTHDLQATLVVCAYQNHNLSEVYQCVRMNVSSKIKHIIIASDIFSFNIFAAEQNVSIIPCNLDRETLQSVVSGDNHTYRLSFSQLRLDRHSLMLVKLLSEHGTITPEFNFINKKHKTTWNYKYRLMRKLGISGKIDLMKFLISNKFSATGKIVL